MTQEALAEKLGGSFQAVSKWETEKAAPDITFLPRLADVFGCSIDELFARAAEQEQSSVPCFDFPWEDDHIIRGVVCEGRTILQASEMVETFTFEIVGDVKSVDCRCN